MLFVVSMLYAALVFISITFLSDMPLIVLAGLLYVLPLIVSVVVTNKLIKQSKNTGIAKLIMVPLLSLLFYISFGILLNKVENGNNIFYKTQYRQEILQWR